MENIDDREPKTFILLASHTKYSPKYVGIVSPNYSIIRISSLDYYVSGSSSGSSSESSGCVWRSTCSNPHHQDHQLLFKVDNSGGGGPQQLLFKLDNLGFPEFGDFSERVRDLGLPDSFKYAEFGKQMIGSCNGIICLYDSTLSEFSLWNPTTGELKILPRAMKVVKDYLPMRLVGFGFDDETKDHKVVLITGFSSSSRPIKLPIECGYRVQIYSLSTDSWRLLEGITSLPGNPFFSYPWEVVCLGSCCFFLAQFFHTKQQLRTRKNTMFVISFDFTKEIFTPIQLPDHHHPHQKLYLRCLGVYKLVLFKVGTSPCPSPPGGYYEHIPDSYVLPQPPTNYSGYPESYEPPRSYSYSQVCGTEDYNLWLLDKPVSSSSGIVNKESWIPWHSFQLEHQRPGEWTSPSCVSINGDFLLLETKTSNCFGNKMKVYNFATQEVTKDFLCCSEVISKAYAYEPSLVKLMVGSIMPTNQAYNQA